MVYQSINKTQYYTNRLDTIITIDMKENIKNKIKTLPFVKQVNSVINTLKNKSFINNIDKDKDIECLADKPFDPKNPIFFAYRDNLDKFYAKRQLFKKIIIWGFKEQIHTHRFIHKHFYETLIKLGDTNFVWVDDLAENQHLIGMGDLVIVMNMACENIVFKKDVFYCTHNIDNTVNFKENISVLQLQVYHNRISFSNEHDEYWEKVTLFNKLDKTLYQAWGTNLLPSEFYEPVYTNQSDSVYWVGSIWNNEHDQGNLNEMSQMKNSIIENKLKFIHKENVSVKDNIDLVRKSRIAPAFSGKFQVDVDYLPCRVFKNISYGQPAISNVNKFKELLNTTSFQKESIHDTITHCLKIDKATWINKVTEQQIYVANNHTYLNKLNNIFTAIEQVYFK
jgi:hypothetical protein